MVRHACQVKLNSFDRKTTELWFILTLRLDLTTETACYTAFPTTFLPNSKEYKAHNQTEETRPHHCCFHRSSLASDQTADRVQIVTVDVSKPSRTTASYITDLLIRYEPTRALCTADAHLLEVPRCRLRTQGEKAISSAAPRLWNNLPLAMRTTDSLSSFKKQLKTFLFKRAFSL